MQRLSNFDPKSLMEALDALTKASHPDGIESFSQTPEKELGDRYVKTLGKTISVEWNLIGDSSLSSYFKNEGIEDIDQMVKIVILAFYRKLNSLECDLESIKKDLRSVFK